MFFDEGLKGAAGTKFWATGIKDNGRVSNVCSYLRCGELRTAKRQEAVQ